jgi:hypothetical protein|tara:strand:- start:1146 stop:1316 length:171 start_codon:yes stop_codon:yes gene_type:complete
MSKEKLNISLSELATAKFIIDQHSDNIKPGKIHENNQTVIDWVNNAKQIVKDNNSE